MRLDPVEACPVRINGLSELVGDGTEVFVIMANRHVRGVEGRAG